MTQNVVELSNAVTTGKLHLPKQPDDDDAVDGAKRYKRFPLVHRNIIKMPTLTEDMDDSDIPRLKPTDIMLDNLGCGPPASIQGQLGFLLESNGNLGHPEAAACTALRHGFMTSTPNPNSPNGALCLWLYPHESYGETMSAGKRMKFAEQAGSGQKYDNMDLTLLTESKIVLPHSFGAFFHMLKNIWHITELFGGKRQLRGPLLEEDCRPCQVQRSSLSSTSTGAPKFLYQPSVRLPSPLHNLSEVVWTCDMD